MAAECMVVGLLGLWFALSVVAQFHHGRWVRRIRRYDIFGLVPTWTFFAPRPSVNDYHILYRDKTAEGTVGPWRELFTHHYSPVLRGIWNPRKREAKVISDVCGILLRTSASIRKTKRLFIHLPYLWLAALAADAPRSPLSVSRQFLVAQTDGYRKKDKPRVLFLSEFHLLDDSINGSRG